MRGAGAVASSHPRAAGPITEISDDFSGDLSAWTQANGSWSISGGVLVPPATSNARIRHTTDLSSVDHWAQVDFSGTQENGVGGSIVELMVRYSASADTFYMGRYHAFTESYEIYRRVAGTFGLVAISGATNPGSWTGRLEVEGSSLRLYNGSALVLSGTDSNISDNTRVGLRSHDNSVGITYDNFLAGTGF